MEKDKTRTGEWPVGGGEMGALIRGHDWAATALGPIESWPHTLKNAVDLILHTPVAMTISWGQDGIYFYNDAFIPLAGTRHPVLLGCRMIEGWPELSDFAAHVLDVALSGETLSLRDQEITLLRAGAPEQAIFNVEYFPLLNESGTPAGLFAVVTETTAARRAEAALRESEFRAQRRLAEIEAIYEFAPIGLCVMDPQLRFVRVNRRFAEMNGWPAEAHIGKTPGELNPDLSNTAEEALRRVLETGEPLLDLEVRGTTAARPGVQRIWNEHWVPLRDPDGKVVGVSIAAEEITDRKRAEEALRESRAKLEATLASMTDAVFISDTEGRFSDFNNAFATFHKFRNKEQCAKTLAEYPDIFDVFLPDGTAAPLDMWAVPRALRGETVTNAEYILRRKDTGETWVGSYSLGPIRNKEGVIVGSVVVSRDITERKRAEEALRDSEQRYRALFESMQEGFAVGEIICAKSGEPVDWRYLDVNPAFESMFGRKHDEVVGRTYRELFPDASWEYWVASLGRVALTGSPAHLGQFGTDFGRHYEAIAYSFRPGRFAAIFTDVTERKRAEERLRESQKLESIGLLAGGIAHDFNNLLTGIMGNASIALDEVDTGPVEQIKEVISSAERAAHLTRQLLAYAGKGQFVVQDLDVSQAVNEIVDLVQFSIPKSVDLAINVRRRLPAVRMDPSQMQQLLMNLVINAGEAIGEGNPGKITVATLMTDITEPFVDAIGEDVAPGRYVCIEVSDTGSGIDEETKSKIFEPFFTTKFTGRGLGLAAVAGIIRSLKGAITVESVPGHGTAIRVFLPMAERRVRGSGEQPAENGRGTILVVDDEPTVREFIAAVLRKQGYRILTASDGRDALAVWDKADRNIDAVVLDVVMPVMGANELLPKMKGQQPKLKILLTSGHSESEGRRLCAAYPGAEFIQKPYTAQQIAKAVEELLGAARQ